MAKKQLTQKEIKRRREYQRQWRIKQKARKAGKSIKNKAETNTSNLVEIVKAYQLLMQSTPDGQVKADPSKCFTSILKTMD